MFSLSLTHSLIPTLTHIYTHTENNAKTNPIRAFNDRPSIQEGASMSDLRPNVPEEDGAVSAFGGSPGLSAAQMLSLRLDFQKRISTQDSHGKPPRRRQRVGERHLQDLPRSFFQIRHISTG